MCPKMGIGTSVSTAVSERTAVVIEDYMFDASTAGELQPEESPSDFHDTWDLDGTDFTPEASPDDEGYWDDFENIVLNHNYEELGSEKVNYPSDVSSITDPWILDSSTNKYKYVDSGSGTGRINFGTPFAVEVGQIYKVEVDITISSGNANIAFKSGNSQTSLFNNRDFSNGLNTFFTTVSGINGSIARIFVNGNNTDNDFTLNSISVKQVDPNNRWQLQYTGTGDWSITDKLNFENVNGGSAQLNVFEVGTTYEITVDYVFTSGTRLILPYDGSNFPTGGVITTPGSVNGYTYYYTPSSTSLLIYSDGNGNGSIDNVTVREYAIQPLDV